jgi:hypothetical protein
MILSGFGKCVHGGCPEKGRIKKKLTEWVWPRNISYSMQMKEKISLTEFLLGTNHGCITTNPNQNLLQCTGNIPVHFQPKSLNYAPSLEGYAYCVLGFSVSAGSPFSERW